jgi:hypothetical protein
LDSASNGVCLSEPEPNLNVETRQVMDRLEVDRAGILERTLFPRVRRALQASQVYGEKSLNLAPFLQELHARLGCSFLWLTRDGRDVVRSLIDWHNNKFADIYRECSDPGTLAPGARAFIRGLPVEKDTSDFSRPRPQPGEPLHDRWEQLSRLEMCAYYWSTINGLLLSELRKLPRGAWMRIDYTDPTRTDVLEAAEFVGLEGLEPRAVDDMLADRINSLAERGTDAMVRMPPWPDWPEEAAAAFRRIAGPMMVALGYWTEKET